MDWKKLKKLNLKQPKYVFPLILLPIALFLGYTLSQFFSAGPVDNKGVVKDSINMSLPEARGEAMEDKMGAMSKNFAEGGAFSAVDGIGDDVQQKDTTSSGYNQEEMEAIEREKAARLQQMKAEEELRNRQQANMNRINSYNSSGRSQQEDLNDYARELERILSFLFKDQGVRLIEFDKDQISCIPDIIDKVYGQEVVSQFDTFRIPVWVWLLLVAIVFVFLIVFSINRYLLSRRLLVANAKAEESTRMKTNFIKQISHEIRTPLNIVSGFTQVLTSPTTQLSEKEKEEISQQMIEGTERITGLVNKMLELSDMSSQTVLEKKNEVSAQDIARQAVQASGIEQAPHVAFSLQLGQGTDTRFNTHRRSAVRILELLLDNAMKFTHQAESYHAMLEEGKRERVTLTVSYEDSHARFVVEDTGIGIPAKEAERIFDEFVQLDDYYDGTGIGLTVARSLARRLGGDVLLDTSYTDGARFVMTL